MKRKNIVLLFMAILFVGCDKKEDKKYPVNIEIQSYFLSETCNWQNLKSDTVYLINSDAELSKYITCQVDIDFNKYSLIVVCGKEKNKIYELTKQLTQISQDEYEFTIDVIIEDTIVIPTWVVSILTPKISDKAQIHLKQQVLLPVNKELLVGEWELFKYVDLSTYSFTTKPDSVTRPVVINFFDTPTVCNFFDISVTVCAHALNYIDGYYVLTSNSIQFTNLSTTMIGGGPKWYIEFEDALLNNYNRPNLIKIERDTHMLFLFYSQSKKIMLFNKLN